MAQKLTVVVTGSTGKHVGAVARGLLERGHNVRAITKLKLQVTKYPLCDAAKVHQLFEARKASGEVVLVP